jgi:hypothetical protein
MKDYLMTEFKIRYPYFIIYLVNYDHYILNFQIWDLIDFCSFFLYYY